MAMMQVETFRSSWRFRVVIGVVFILALLICARIIQLQVVNREFLVRQGDARSLRHISVSPNRGFITDRNGQALSVSTPMTTVWLNPKELLIEKENWSALAKALNVSQATFSAIILRNRKKEFVYLHRRMPPQVAEQLMHKVNGLKVAGVYTMQESRRFYPTASIAAHVTGFTDVDNRGSEGVELAYNDLLAGSPGKQLVVKDRRGHVIQDLGVSLLATPGETLQLSLDLRLQYVANRELLKGVKKHRADAGSVVIMDVKTGEILALANQPSFNPNNRSRLTPSMMRNRAVVDVFEPASTMKPFAMAAALETGRWKPADTVHVDTGNLNIGKYTIRDVSRTAGQTLSMTDILVRSSNVAISKVAFDIGGVKVYDLMRRVGFGQETGIGFPGEQSGVLPARREWRPTETAALSYGYGVSVTSVQLARAYATLVNAGVSVPLSLLRVSAIPKGTQVIPAVVANAVKEMLVQVVEGPKGIYRAKIPGFHVGGKSGTAKKTGAASKGYLTKSYRAIFAGFAPASNPKFVIVVIVDNPKSHGFFGGLVAAPLFSKIMSETLRLNNTATDNH